MIKKKTWSKMTASEKRVALAEDVIKHVRAEFMIVESGTYAAMDYYKSRGHEELGAREFLKENKNSCTVCAKGALMCANILERNECSVGDFDAGNLTIKSRLRGIFGSGQLDLIECCFEQSVQYDEANILWTETGRSKLAERAIKMGGRYTTDKGRLVGIMKNIIKNNGTFKP